MQIRYATQADYDGWTQMVTDYVPAAAKVCPRAWARFNAPNPRDFCVVAIEDGQPIAFMQYTFHDFPFATKPICYMDSLYVRPEYRGRGIAGMLLAYLTSLGVANGWGRIYWVTENNNPIRPFYDKVAAQGFVRYNQDL
jgi:GNAT superfamily N-acetyltransferase